MIRSTLFAGLVLALPLAAAEPTTPATQMNSIGKLSLSDDLSAAFGKEWKAAKGKWEVVDGGMRGAELPADMHGAVSRRNVEMKDAVIAFSFKLDGAKQISLSLNGAKGHVCRVILRSNGMIVQKDDQDGKGGPDKGEALGKVDLDIKPGVWHTVVVELRGADILATLDGKETAFGTHAAINQPKTNLGFTVAGESASFKDLRVWESTAAQKDWDTLRSKLFEAKKKS